MLDSPFVQARGSVAFGRSLSSERAEEFDSVADATLFGIENDIDRLSHELNPEEVSCTYGVLTLDFGARGVWVINKQKPNSQLWWSSPISGPRRFEYNQITKKWEWTRDPSVQLDALLHQELSTLVESKS